MKSLHLFTVIAVLGLVACKDVQRAELRAQKQSTKATELSVQPFKSQGESSQVEQNLELNVYKSPSCGCCGEWIEHLQKQKFKVQSHDLNDLSALKESKGIKPQYQSCHTAISEQNYVFEGHIPAKYIQQFLQAPPENALGLSVPAMPVGSPGMQMGETFMPYEVKLLNKDGSATVYAKVNTLEEQYQ